MAEHGDGCLHVWECVHVLFEGRLDERLCGHMQMCPGTCPFDHGDKDPELIEIVAVVQCPDCSMPIPLDDCRRPDGRLVCGDCAMAYMGEKTGEQE